MNKIEVSWIHIDIEDKRGAIVDKSWSGDSTQLLQEIDWKMSRIESIRQQVSDMKFTRCL